MTAFMWFLAGATAVNVAMAAYVRWLGRRVRREAQRLRAWVVDFALGDVTDPTSPIRVHDHERGDDVGWTSAADSHRRRPRPDRGRRPDRSSVRVKWFG